MAALEGLDWLYDWVIENVQPLGPNSSDREPLMHGTNGFACQALKPYLVYIAPEITSSPDELYSQAVYLHEVGHCFLGIRYPMEFHEREAEAWEQVSYWAEEAARPELVKMAADCADGYEPPVGYVVF